MAEFRNLIDVAIHIPSFLRLNQGGCVRLHILNPSDGSKGVKAHFAENSYIACKKDGCCELIETRARWRIGLVVYEYDSKETFPWIIGERAYQQIRTQLSINDTDTVDLIVTCTNSDYQQIEVQIRKSLFNESFYRTEDYQRAKTWMEERICVSEDRRAQIMAALREHHIQTSSTAPTPSPTAPTLVYTEAPKVRRIRWQ